MPRRTDHRRTLRTAVSGALAVLISQAAWLAAPTPASADPVPGDAASPAACADAEPMAGDENAATALAARCGHEVEVSADADEFGGVFAQPDGRMIWRGGVEPYRAKEDDGSWQPIDTTLSLGPDGLLTTKNTVTPVAFSGGGNTPFAQMTRDGESFGLTWPGALPTPTVSGNTATYAGVLPGVDLVVRALPEGFGHDLVVHSAKAAANPKLAKIRLGVTGKGVKVAVTGDGGFSVTSTASGEEFAASPAPLMWDSPAESDGLALRSGPAMMAAGAKSDVDVARIGVEASGQSIALIPDKALLTGADTQYPVTIDPLWTGGTRNNEWGTVWEKFPTQISWKGGAPTMGNASTYGNAGVGQTCDNWSGLTCTSSKYRMRSFFRMDTEAVSRNPDRDIISAQFKILQRWSANCNNTGKAKLWATSIIESTNTWNNQPTWHEDTTAWSTGAANHGASCGGPEYIAFDVKKMAQEAKDGLWYSFTVGMRAPNESPSPDLNEWRRYDGGTARLEIEFNTRPKIPTGPSTDAKGCATTAPGTWVTTMTPTLTVSPQDSDGGTVTAIFDVYAANGTLAKEWTVSSAANKPVTTTVPAGTLTAGAYYWNARTSDGRATSSASAKCYFQVDTNPPPTPTATLLTADPIVGSSVSFAFQGPPDTAKFKYSLTGGSWTQVATATDGKATGSVTPPKTSLDHVLQIWAVDAAGNESARLDLGFSTRLPSQTGYWPLAGDGVDKTGAHDLTIPDTATWATDSFGKANGAMHTDPATCAMTTAPVVDPTKSFTVSVWAKTTTDDPNLGRSHHVLSQMGTTTGGFQLNAGRWSDGQYRYNYIYWGVKPDGKLAGQSVVSSPLTADAWHHVTITFDLDAAVVKLYVDGVAAGFTAAPVVAAPSPDALSVGCKGKPDPMYNFAGDIHDVRVFDGTVSAEQAGAIAAKPVSVWSLNETGLDAVGGNNLTFNGTPTWDDDRNDFPKFAYALSLGGNSYAQSTVTGVRTDKSFTVAAWAKLTDKSADRTVLSQAGVNRSGFYLGYLKSADRWQFTMPSADASSVTWSDAKAASAPEIGAWYHLAATYDATLGKVRFYVNGELQSTANAPAIPWNADGPVLIGAAGTKTTRWDYMVGAIDDVRLYAGVIDDVRLTDISCSYVAICGGA